jgi:hypothetical protein
VNKADLDIQMAEAEDQFLNYQAQRRRTILAPQNQFQPLLYPVKGQIPEYYRSV